MARDCTATRERTLDGAERLVLEYGFGSTAVDGVVATSGAATVSVLRQGAPWPGCVAGAAAESRQALMILRSGGCTPFDPRGMAADPGGVGPASSLTYGSAGW